MSGLTYVITGANRGIGKALLTTFILRPNTTVIASVRDVASASKTLIAIPVGPGSKLIIIKIDATSATDAATAVTELETLHKITQIDILISNAGFMGPIGPALSATPSNVCEHFEINVLGPLTLIQAFYPLLSLSPKPKFLLLSSSIGSLGEMENLPVPFFAYGLSKIAANYLVRKLHFENEGLISMVFNPGWVQTDMGDGAAKGVGMMEAPMTVEESVEGLVREFDGASKERSGLFVGSDGKVIPW